MRIDYIYFGIVFAIYLLGVGINYISNNRTFMQSLLWFIPKKFFNMKEQTAKSKEIGQ